MSCLRIIAVTFFLVVIARLVIQAGLKPQSCANPSETRAKHTPDKKPLQATGYRDHNKRSKVRTRTY